MMGTQGPQRSLVSLGAGRGGREVMLGGSQGPGNGGVGAVTGAGRGKVLGQGATGSGFILHEKLLRAAGRARSICHGKGGLRSGGPREV